MSKPITKIHMTAFRGAVGPFELDFDPQKDLTMLFGENGSGKSSILDAIDVVCRGTNGSLDDVSVGPNRVKYLCALGCPSATLKVKIDSDAESWTGTMQGRAVRVVGATEKPKVKTLRRSHVLKLVLAQPNERYDELRRFIDIATVEQSEASLRQKLNDADSDFNELSRTSGQLSTQLEDFWQAENRPGPGQTAMEWAGNKVNTGITALNTRLERLTTVVDAISAATTASTNYGMRATTHTNLKNQLAAVDHEIAAAPSVKATTAVKLLDSLEKAKAYIEAEQSLDKCPTCQRPISRDELLASVTQEVTQLTELKTLTTKRRGIQQQLDVAASLLQEAIATLVAALKDAHEETKAGDIPEIVVLNIGWPTWTNTTQDISGLLAINAQLHGVQSTLESQRDNAQRDVNQFNSIKQSWRGIQEAAEKIIELDRIRTGLRQALAIVHDKRVTFTQGILDGIGQEANRLFQAIHPGENIGLEQLKMEEERRSSVSQTGVFHGYPGIPPQAIFSESHLDTLGFCVWLALAKREAPEQTILLIDDIFSSVDAAHLSRIIDMLSTEASSFLQVIVATHYRLWWDRCQNAQGIQRVHLGRWCATNGIAAQNMPLVTEQLRQLVAQPVLDRQAVSSKAGILLESILDDLALLYECSLPHNKLNLHTLGALLNGCGKLFSKHNLTVQMNTNWNVDGQPENWQATTARAAFDRISALQFIRNQVGCHFNAPGMEIPDNDVRDFGSATVALMDAITCPNCGALAAKTATDGTYLRCSCPKRAARMTPVAIQ